MKTEVLEWKDRDDDELVKSCEEGSCLERTHQREWKGTQKSKKENQEKKRKKKKSMKKKAVGKERIIEKKLQLGP